MQIMSDLKSSKLSMNVLINKEKSKVLFAEANGHVVDVLLHFLTMPFGKIVRLFNHYYDLPPTIGCLTGLYGDLFDKRNFSVGDDNQLLFMGSTSLGSECRKMINDFIVTTQQSHCQNSSCPFSGASNATLYPELNICSFCQEPLLDEDGGVFMANASLSFVISDDLRVVPIRMNSFQTVYDLGIMDTDGAKLRSFSFDIDDVVELLELSLTSSTPLTDLVFGCNKIRSVLATPKLYPLEKSYTNYYKFNLKVSLQISTNRFLFAEATEEFVKFLFSFLTLPLGGVQSLLGGKTGFVNLVNLYRSVADGFDDDYFRNQDDTRMELVHPYMAHFMDQFEGTGDAEGEKAMFIVRDDLTVEPFSVASAVLILNGLRIPLSDVKEMVLNNIGFKEALRILEASLTSKTALTDAIIKPNIGMSTVPSLDLSESQLSE